jgi:UDP-N-acetylglucosamine 3-dehydrogenase
MIGQTERFNPTVTALKDLMTRETSDTPIACYSRRIVPYSPRIRDQGVILGLAIHDIDIFRYIFESECDTVFARALKVLSGFDDYATLVLELKNKVVCTTEVSQVIAIKERFLNITFRKSYVYADLLRQQIWAHKSVQDKEESSFSSQRIGVKKQSPLTLELQHFVGISKDRERQPLVDGAEGLRNLTVALAALDSVKKGKVTKPIYGSS